MRRVIIFCVFLTQTLISDVHANQNQLSFFYCQEPLTQKEVNLKFGSKDDFTTSLIESVYALNSIATQRGDNTAALKSATLIELLDSFITNEHDAHRETRGKPITKAMYKAAMKAWGATDEGNIDAVKAFNNPTLYRALGSNFQRLFSTLIVSYGLIQSDLTKVKKPRILDLGSGIGDTAYVINELMQERPSIVLADGSLNQLLGSAVEMPDATKVLLDFRKPLPFRNGSFNAIISVSAISQYTTPDEFSDLMLELKRILVPGGIVLFEFGPNSRAARQMSLDNFLEKMIRLGFHPEDDVALKIRVNRQVFYPILLRKPN